uniref:RRM domain-containing protein n=1 Tax=Mola mola TaxID=94237 RepID=A0A3Q3VSK6_MOLML
MTIILRLQGLDVKASTEDIRTFFKCLHIPDGGVYIVGGSLREAFIAFTTEKDAQLAMRYSGKALKGSKVTLHISSMDELEHKLKSLLRKKKPSPTQHTINRSQPSPKANLQPLNAGPPPSDLSNTSALVPTKEEICHFFSGLKVQEAIVNVKLGLGHCCLVKFASEQEACEAFLFNQQSLGPHCVEVCGATEMMWTSALKPKKSPLRETLNHKQKPTALQIKRQFANWLPPKSSKKLRPFDEKKPNQKRKFLPVETLEDPSVNTDPAAQTWLFVRNMPADVQKSQIKSLLCKHKLKYSSIILLLDSNCRSIGEAVVEFKSEKLAALALKLNGQDFLGSKLLLSCINIQQMKNILRRNV